MPLGASLAMPNAVKMKGNWMFPFYITQYYTDVEKRICTSTHFML